VEELIYLVYSNKILLISLLRNELESLACRSQNFAPNLTCRTVRWPIPTLNAPYCQHNSLLSVSKLKPTSPRYLPYLNAFPGVVVPAKKPIKKPAKKPAKQALKSTPVTLTPAAPPADSTRLISNTRAYLCTASVIPKAFTTNKHRKPSTPPPLGPPKPS